MAKKKRSRNMRVENKHEKYNTSFRSTARNSTKGTAFDTLNRQVAVKRELNDKYIDNLLSSNELAKNLLTAPIEDSLKNGFELTFLRNNTEDINLRDQVFAKMDELNFIEKLKELLVETRKRGYALFYYIYNDGDNTTGAIPNANSEIIGINILTKQDISEIKLEQSKLSQNFGEIKSLKVSNKKDEYIIETVEINSARVELAYQNRTKDKIGTTIFNQLIDRIVIQDTTEWSIGQLIYRAVFLQMKTDESTLNNIKKTGIAQKENEINTSTVAFIGKDDDISAVNSTAGLDPEKYLNSAATILSMHTNIPKQRLMGNALGAIAGAEEDAKKYAEYLTRFFNAFAVPIINGFIDKLLNQMRHTDVVYQVYLDSLLEKDDLKEAQTEEAEAKATNEKLKVIEETIAVMNKVGLNPAAERVKILVEQIKTGEKLTGQHLSELWKKAEKISETSLEIEKEKSAVITSKANAIMTASNAIQNTGFTGEKNDIAKLAKLLDESQNPFEDLMKLLGEKDDINTQNRNGTQTQTNT
ncbi:MAG: DUF1073 domain-containing protein [Fusobacteriales bacterium]|jgi:phage-related protein (TIGR01555 family)|nr:DUF1073 domain-containing protein [Fusobacteriales bacterium]